MFAPSDALSAICDTERTGGCQSAEARSPGNVTVAGLGRWHGIANRLLLISSSGRRDTYWRWRVAAQVWKAFESSWKEIFHELQPQCPSFHLWTQLSVLKGIKVSSKKWVHRTQEGWNHLYLFASYVRKSNRIFQRSCVQCIHLF